MSLYDDLPEVYGTGEILKDNRTDWKKHKVQSLAVSRVMLAEKRQERMAGCSSMLHFAVDKQGNKRLHRANFCRDRMCPLCARRRSLKVFHQIRVSCLGLLKERPSTAFLMLTLTVPNVHQSELPDTLTHLFKSWDRLSRRSEFKGVFLGWFRALEITKELRRNEYYHPHFHVLLACPSYYFKTKKYITQQRWLELWREATRQPEITQVDIRRVKPNRRRVCQGALELNDQDGSSPEAITSAAAEVGKYATKPGDYLTQINQDEYEADQETVSVLADAVKGRRIIAFGGELKRILALHSNEDINDDTADLVHTGEESSDIQAVMIQIYRWHNSIKSYIG